MEVPALGWKGSWRRLLKKLARRNRPRSRLRSAAKIKATPAFEPSAAEDHPEACPGFAEADRIDAAWRACRKLGQVSNESPPAAGWASLLMTMTAGKRHGQTLHQRRARPLGTKMLSTCPVSARATLKQPGVSRLSINALIAKGKKPKGRAHRPACAS